MALRHPGEQECNNQTLTQTMVRWQDKSRDVRPWLGGGKRSKIKRNGRCAETSGSLRVRPHPDRPWVWRTSRRERR